MRTLECFRREKALIGCVHLKALPGAPLCNHSLEEVTAQALAESAIIERAGFDGLIIENFNDYPFYPERVPPETIAAMSVVGHEVRRAVGIPIGVNVLRNDAHAAIAIASAIGAEFVRINVHQHAVVADQGILEGRAHHTMRLKKSLGSRALVFADVAVKHASPLGVRSIVDEARDLSERGLVDALIVSGAATGSQASLADLRSVKESCPLPVFVGSGITPDNLSEFMGLADGLIVGSSLKEGGQAKNCLERCRAESLASAFAKNLNNPR